MMKMNRRTFLKTTAAAALAVSMSGALTGCGQDFGATARIGDFVVTVTPDIAITEVGNTSGCTFKPKAEFKYVGSGFAGTKFDSTFAAQVSNQKLKLTNGNQSIVGLDLPFGRSKVYEPEFSASQDAYDAFLNGSAIQLKVTLQNQTASFLIYKKDGKIMVTVG